MKSNYKPLGLYIEQYDQRASEGAYSLDDIRGISSITKEFNQTKANLVDVTVDKYKIVPPKYFAYNPNTARMGDKIPIALNKTATNILVSSIYPVFKLDDSQLLPEYLLLWFKRPEFDRYARYKSHGSAREIFDWNEMCKVELPVPTIEVQQNIINAYQTIDDRITLKKQINDNLEATGQAYFDELFFRSSASNCTLADIAEVNPARPLRKGEKARCFDMATLPTKGCIPSGYEIKPYNGGVRFTNGDTLIARITPCLENGKAAYINLLKEGEVAFGSTEYIVFTSKDAVPSSFYYFLIRNSQFVTFALQFMNGSSGRQRVSGEELASFPLTKPSADSLKAFDKVGAMVLEQMKENTLEIQELKQLQEIITATLSNR